MAQTNSLSISTFNCIFKSSLPDIWKLCNSYDIILFQEHWLLPFKLHTLSSIHTEFLVVGTSAVDVSKNILHGHAY